MSQNRSAVPTFVYGALVFSLALNVLLLLRGGPSEAPVTAPDAEFLEEDAMVDDGPPGEVAETAQPAEEAAAGADDTQWSVLRGKVDHSLARTFQTEAGENGDALSGVFTRLFVWDLDMRRDLQAGDSVAVVWRLGVDGLPEIAAASLESQKLRRTSEAFAWKAPGDTYASFWSLDGKEVPLRLVDGPLEQYEQITSLLKDRPNHKGMDFKAPVGTEVRSPLPGTVTRVNWNWTANGNCIEVRYEDGVLAKFLHLSENKVTEGQKVGKGQVIALTGNTGHSTAPHLHYQIDKGARTLDPLEYHGSVRRSLTADQTAALKKDVSSFSAMLEKDED